MSEEYAEDYMDTADSSSEVSDDFQDTSSSYGEESLEEGQTQETDSSSAIADAPPIRDLYGRFGQVNSQIQNQSQQLSAVTEKLSELASALEKNASGSQSSSSIYDTMDADQKSAATKLVEEHPIVKELSDFKSNLESQQEQVFKSQLEGNKAKFASAIEELRSAHGSSVADKVGSDLYQVAELANWDLSHPYFIDRLKSHQSELEGSGKEKQQERQRATSERGGTRTKNSRLPTAKRKTPAGKEYYSFAAAAELAEKMAAENRRN